MVEVIPDEDYASRHIDQPHKYREDVGLLWNNTFTCKPGRADCLVWRKYAETIQAVHDLGCQRQAEHRQTKPDWTYVGAITAQVGAIRLTRSAAGHGFKLVHTPDEGLHHIEVHVCLNPESKYEKPQRAELRYMLGALFETFEPHQCA